MNNNFSSDMDGINMYYKKIIIAYLLLSSSAIAGELSAGNGNLIDGEYGTLHVYGTLTESACHLAAGSEWQDINLGNLSHFELWHTGDQSPKVKIKIYLKDCPQTEAVGVNDTSLLKKMSDDQPVATAKLDASTSPDDPQLFSVVGAKGFGLHFSDEQGKTLVPGKSSGLFFASTGQNVLNWTVQARRTASSFTPGAWQAFVNFSLTYF